MKTVFAVLGVIFLILLAIVGLAFAYVAHVGSGLDASSKAYVDSSIPAIVTNWSKDELEKRASPDLLKASSDAQISEFFTQVAGRSGSFQRYDGSKGEANLNFTFTKGLVCTAAYVATVTFQNGQIDIKVTLNQVNGDWRFLGFNVVPHSGS